MKKNDETMPGTNSEIIQFYTSDQDRGPVTLSDKENRIIQFINTKIASFDDLEQTIDFLFEQIQPLVPTDRIAIAFFEEGGQRLAIQYVKTGYKPLYLDSSYSGDLHDSSLQKIFSHRLARIIHDVKEYSRTHESSGTAGLLAKEGIQSNMTNPLILEGRPVGVIFHSSKQKNAYSEKSIRLYSHINERLSQTVEKTYRIKKLSDAINDYMEMLGFVTHELKSPLDSIITMGNTLSAGYFGELDNKHKQYIERMVNKARYLKELSLQYLNLSRFESGNISLNKQGIDFEKEVLQESLDIILPQVKEKNISLSVDTQIQAITVSCDPSLMKIVTGNLLSNAVKYSDNNGTVAIKAYVKNDQLFFSVKNSGPGFSAADRNRLFRKFSRLEKEELNTRKGSGIGLYTSWKIIMLHTGTIDAESREGEWARFHFSIPVQ